MADLDSSIQSDANEVLLHPDALRCLQKKQLASLCIRLDLKAIGKKDELIARLEGYNQGKAALAESPSKGRIVQARPRLRSISMASIASADTLNDKENEGDLTTAGPSIRLISDDEMNPVSVHSRGQRSILGEQIANDIREAATLALPSSSTKSIYPWKRMSTASSLKMGRDASNSIADAPMAARDDTMTLDEFGKSTKISEEPKGSLGNLKKWLNRSNSTSQPDIITEQSPLSQARIPPISSPASKRKRDDNEDMDSKTFYMCDMPEVPVKRVIKPRPSRAAKKVMPQLEAEVAEASNAASKVLEEMNARLQHNGKSTLTQIPSQGVWTVDLKPPPAPLKSLNARTKGRFSGEHAKHFKKMDSIASHYAAKRIELANKEWRSASGGSTSSNRQAASKRLKIAEPSEEEKTKTAEHRAAIQKKLEMARQRRKSVSKPGLRSRFTGAVRGFVGAAVGLSNATPPATPTSSSSSPAKVHPRKPSPSPILIASPKVANPKPVFDLKASLAKKPTGYKPYSAKETVQLLQAAASPSKPSPSTTAAVAPFPIRTGWTVVNSTAGPVIPPRLASNKATTSTIAFPSVSPNKDGKKNNLAVAVQAAPTIVRRPSAHTTAARKTRSSISNAKRGPMQAEKLKRASKMNDKKHQASMMARQKTQASVRRAVEKGEKIAAEIASGVGRGTPRKASAKVVMDGAGRGQAAVKRVS